MARPQEQQDEDTVAVKAEAITTKLETLTMITGKYSEDQSNLTLGY